MLETMVLGFMLIDARADVERRGLAPGAVIDLGTDEPFNIRADVTDEVARVEFRLNGQVVRTERAAPFAVGGEVSGDYHATSLPTGEHRLEAIPFDAGGSAGTPLSMTVRVVSGRNASMGVDVRSFGARCDGRSDDTAAIQAALDSVVGWTPQRCPGCGSGGGVVWVPSAADGYSGDKHCMIAKSLRVYANTTLRSGNRNSGVIAASPDFPLGASMVILADGHPAGNGPAHGARIQDMTLECAGRCGKGIEIQAPHEQGSGVYRVQVANVRDFGIWCDGTQPHLFVLEDLAMYFDGSQMGPGDAGIHLGLGCEPRRLDGVTVTVSGAPSRTGVAGISLKQGGQVGMIRSVHCENLDQCVWVQAPQVFLSGIVGRAMGRAVVELMSMGGCRSTILQAIMVDAGGGGFPALIDNCAGVATAPNANIAWYSNARPMPVQPLTPSPEH